MARILCFSDSHLRHRYIDQMLAWEEPYDQAVFLGDYLDGWGDTVEQNLDAAAWVKERLADPRSIMLAGNHDLPMIFPHHEGIWRRHDHQHEILRGVRAILSDADLARLLPYHLDPTTQILFSHAGVSAKLINHLAPFLGMPFPDDTAKSIASFVDECWASAVVRYRAGRDHPLLAIGRSRGGDQLVGGIIWEDLDLHVPIPHVVQIVGHSTRPEAPLFRFLNHPRADSPPMWRRAGVGVVKPEWLTAGATLGLDTNNKHYALICTEKRTLTIKSVTWNPAIGEFPRSVSPGKEITCIQLPPKG